MDDPVMIGSGVTFDRASIEHWFKICETRAEEAHHDLEDSDYDYDSYFKCPETL